MAVLVPAVLAMAAGDSDNSPSVFLPRLVSGTSRLAVSKPSWVVRTAKASSLRSSSSSRICGSADNNNQASNVRREKMKKPDPSCVVCAGSGRIYCHNCQGRGRTNCLELAMLPKGEWPRWCKVCGGSGLDYCNRCLGTGEYRDIMGFHLRKTKPPQRLGNPMDDHGIHTTGDGS